MSRVGQGKLKSPSFNIFQTNHPTPFFVNIIQQLKNKKLYAMKNKMLVMPFILLFMGMAACQAQPPQDEKKNPYYKPSENSSLSVTDKEWKKILSPKVYNIMREKGTEAPGTGPYVHNEKKGTYYCAACGHPLFSSANKFDSHTGWPSFYQALGKNSVIEEKDNSVGMSRTEVVCARCGGHLGHVFDDGPAPTGLRYCMNGYALHFEEAK
jgi:peptide-methionine (R)-S-oxide reductase